MHRSSIRSTAPGFTGVAKFCRDQQRGRARWPLHLSELIGEIAMSIRNMLFAVAFGIVSLTAARAEGLRPMAGKSIDLGGISGIAYYTDERDGFHVVATLAQGEGGTPIRVVSVLAPG